MAKQAASTLMKEKFDIGNAVLYYTDNIPASLTEAETATYNKMGMMLEGVVIERSLESIPFESGFPLKTQKKFFTRETIRVTGTMLEFHPQNLARALGGPTITYTTKASSPTPTTVASGSSGVTLEVADATGFAADKLLKVGSGSDAQYVWVKSVSNNTITLYEAPATAFNVGDPVAEVDKASIDYGSVSEPADVALKISKTHVASGDTMNWFIRKAQADGNVTLNFPDNGVSQGNGIPFAFEAVSDPDVDSGDVMRFTFTQN